MSFAPVPAIYEDEERDEDEDGDEGDPLPPLAEYLAETQGDARFTDTCLQTKLKYEKLDKSLLKIETEAHSLLQEQGIEVLFLALGCLEWYEDNNARSPRRAPLILIPVEMVRSSAVDSFRIQYTGAELAPNVVLGAKLKGDFRIDLPGFDDELDLPAYFRELEERIAAQPRWKVLPDHIALGLFSFGKYQMYMDLDAASWPDDKSPADHPLLRKLFEGGFEKDAVYIGDVGSHQHLSEPEALHLVKDADSSQTEAILAAIEGANVVIQGPPGTGKSQTITNLISEAVARGKKVLFVAQKLAALEVVKQRLDESHLGDAVLELHSHKSTKKAVLESLRKSFTQGKPTVPDRTLELNRLKETREQLNGYVDAVRRPLLNSGLNYVQALGELLKLKRVRGADALVELPFSLMESWDLEMLLRAERAALAVAEHIDEKGVPADNPFSMSYRTSLSPTEQQTIGRLVAESQALLEKLLTEAGNLAQDMALPRPESLSEISVLDRAASRALSAPHLKGLKLSTDDWQLRRDAIRQTLKAGAEMARIREQHQGRFIEAAYQTAVLVIRQGFAGRADKWWRIFSGPYRRAKAAYRGLLKQGLEGKPTQWLASVDELLTFQEQEKSFKEYEQLCQSLFGAQWQGRNSDWEVLGTLSDWIVELYEAIGKGDLPKGVADFLAGDPSLHGWETRLEELRGLARDLKERLGQLVSLVEIGEKDKLSDLETVELSEWRVVLEGWQRTDDLYDLARYNVLESGLEKLGLTALADQCFEWRRSPQLLPVLIKMSYYSGLVNYGYGHSEYIRLFDRISHERLIKEFSTLDGSLLEYSQEALVSRLFEALPNFNAPGEMEVVRRELNKGRRHLPIRRLLSEAPNVIQQAKPVFMMSPMSISTYLAQGKIDFDLVIFDEASQIPAPDALGAVLRGKQLVVVGDSKQMPPTNFFGRAVELDEETAEQSATADIESILGMMLAKGVPEVMLKWHYRSRHHSLIAVSNQEFYMNQLLVFPSPGVHPMATGLRYRYFPDTCYDRGGSRTNVGEARHVAEAVIKHAQETPHLSLGVVAFSTAQRDAIILEIERLRREHPESEAFFEHHPGRDEFFVKNLENVQGDERDVIFISVGYGRVASGNVGQSFGPVNSKGGERRLNVLISRARLAMEVFANFRADDLKTNAESPVGLRALKAFLKYAETGELEVNKESGKAADSPFEEEVHAAIVQLGYEVEAQVGCQGFYIDLAVRDPNKPGRYILAVECDGATYHSSASARDRDRLRQAVLEGLGWRFHRIWSTDWFRSQAGEIQRLAEAIQQSILFYERLDDQLQRPEPAVVPATPRASVVRIERSEANADNAVAIPTYAEAPAEMMGLSGYSSFDDIPADRLAQAIQHVVEHEAPVHMQLLCARLTNAAGFSRAGSKIRWRIEDVVDALDARSAVKRRDEFVWKADQTAVPLRDWSCVTAAHRKYEHICDEELQQAMLLTVKDAFSIGMNDCIGAALNLIGFKRVTTGIRERMEELGQNMVEAGLLSQDGERLKLVG